MEHTKHMRKDILAEIIEKIQYLTVSQQKFLHEMLVGHEKVSTAVSKKRLLKKSFGIWANRKDIKNSVEYVNEMREKWESRLERIKD
ncbi:MAG: hypothetical protein A2889_10780 [Nitrospinae bacterium RIFCSPLOWO2_01_FULL_39_10]|nr:MAG: hypothetical protein A2889_10780 [Nitrospinae bacterium RIFCSPLOWO2_01_FULL_39_10]